MPSPASSRSPTHRHAFPPRRSSDLVHRPARPAARRRAAGADPARPAARGHGLAADRSAHRHRAGRRGDVGAERLGRGLQAALRRSVRSEEHTSELQSPDHLVCRLLLHLAAPRIAMLSLHDALPISFTGLLARLPEGARLVPILPAPQLEGMVSLLIDPRIATVLVAEEMSAQSVSGEVSKLLYGDLLDRKSTRLNSSHQIISYAVSCFISQPHASPCFPSTTLFRSRSPACSPGCPKARGWCRSCPPRSSRAWSRC